MPACPKMSWSIFGGYPAWIISEAAVAQRVFRDALLLVSAGTPSSVSGKNARRLR
jgi:hypothetical protein